ncbi:hypothetical protein F5B19DRAFT_3421 [Rostrohypoxylon terebratum]|nr:hypothetical protein F5B19DRAFT_3421 [Rostrohypoxylon terebratum]
MTTPVSGSSLPQARDVHQHNHFHNSRDSHSRHYQHTHHNHHARSQNRNSNSNSNVNVNNDNVNVNVNSNANTETDTYSGKRGHKRTDSDEPTIIVETISVLQIIDSSGATVTLQTLTPSGGFTPATTINPGSDTSTVDPSTESVAALSLPSISTATSDDAGADSSSTTSTSTIDPTVTPSESSMPTSFPTLSYSPLTSTPLSGSSVFPSLTGVTNTTQASSLSSTSISSNSTSSTSTTSILPFSAESIDSSATSSPVLSSSSSSSSLLSSNSSSPISVTTTTSSGSSSASITSESSVFASSTGSGGDGVGLGGNVQPSSSSTSTADGASGSSSSGPGAATVAGSVLGGVAALAAILILALYLLRWKKRQNTKQLMRGSGSERGPGGALVENSGPAGGGNSGAMSETRRRSIPFAIPAAFASLTGHKRNSGRSGASSDGGERGFSKVSGRKLPPVIQFGGDGYSDPRDTMMSDQSIEYRDSQAFPGVANAGPTRLALGAPMRPDSGIPVYNPGPARTPITEQAPITPPDTSPLEPPPRDPLGPSRPSQDGSNRSHVSVSRFTEVL